MKGEEITSSNSSNSDCSVCEIVECGAAPGLFTRHAFVARISLGISECLDKSTDDASQETLITYILDDYLLRHVPSGYI